MRRRWRDEGVERFAVKQFRFPGVELKARLFRDYPLGELGAHVVGYIGRVSVRDQDRIAEFKDPADYTGTDYIGKAGVEYSYEEQLHGNTGFEEVEITAGGRARRTVNPTAPSPGAHLILSI